MSAFAGRHLVVIGLRASGKTSAGELAAGRLGIAFSDLDELTIEDIDGHAFPTVREAWAEAGEDAFRLVEAAALSKALATQGDDVLALGGGTAAFADARRVLTEAMDAGVVLGPVYLHAPPGVLADRLRRDLGDRPSITGDHPADEIAGLYDKRDGIYRALAEELVEVEHLTMDQAADRLVELWHKLADR
ncbi:MAG: shikimate kinase [Phycisphaerales bacterium]|jgi:shikimate kinase